MIFFAHPKILYLLVIPALLAFWEWARSGQPIVVPVDHQVRRRGWVWLLLVHTANMLPAALLAIMPPMLALAPGSGGKKSP